MKTLACAAAALLCGWPIGVPRTRTAEEHYSVKPVAYAAGTVLRYQVAMKLTSGPASADQVIHVRFRYSETMRTVKPTGERVSIVKFETATVAMGAGTDPTAGTSVLTSMPVITMTTSPEGEATLAFEGGTPSGNSEVGGLVKQIADTARVLRPPTPVNVGGRWNLSYSNANKMLGPQRVEGKAELLAVEKIDRTASLKIGIRATAPASAGAVAGAKPALDGTVNLDPETGRMVAMALKGDGLFAGGEARCELQVKLLGNDAQEGK